MNAATHAITPEEVMSFLDGELSAAEARSVSTHIQNCAECSTLAEKFRTVSHSLLNWHVEPVPQKLENSLKAFAANTTSIKKTAKPSIFIRASFWNWKQWTIRAAAATAALIFALAIILPTFLRREITAPEPEQMSSAVAMRENAEQHAAQFQLQNSLEEDRKASSAAISSKMVVPSPRTSADSRSAVPASAPMIARTVSLTIVVKDFAASRSSLDAILAKHHGYFGELTVSTPENAARSIQASLRIPAADLSSALADLRPLGRVETESQTGEEVSQEHADLVARLKTSRETEDRFRGILQQRTGNVSDVLEVEEAIARVRGDIERMEAEQKALEHRVDFATVDLQLNEEYEAQLNSPSESVATRLHNALVAGFRSASETLLGIILFFATYSLDLVIWLAILAIPVIFLRRRYRKSLATL